MTREHRQEYRLKSPLTVFLEVASAQDSAIVICRSLDVSANGLRVISDAALPLGSILRCSVQNHDASARFMLVADVKWVQPWQNTQEFLVGLALFESEGSDIVPWKQYIAQQCALAESFLNE